MAGLVEGVDVQLQAFVLADDLLCVIVRVEGVHQYQRYVAFVRFVQVLEGQGGFSRMPYSYTNTFLYFSRSLHID